LTDGSATIPAYGTDGNGVYSGDGVTSGIFDPEGLATTSPITITYTYTYTAVATPLLQCVNTATAEITVIALPVVSISGNDEICVNTTTTLLPTSGGTWESTNPSVAEVSIIGVVTGKSAGTARFIFTSSATGCSDTTTVVTVKALPAVSITGDDKICVEATTQLFPSDGSGTWKSTNEAIATVSSSGEVTGISAGTVRFIFTETSTGCSDTTNTVTVTAKVKPIFAFADVHTYCLDDLASLPDDLPTHSLNISPITGNPIEGSWLPSIIIKAIGTETYTFIPSPGQCAEENVTILITVYEQMTAAHIIADDKEVCYTDPVTFTAKSTKMESPTFHWYASQTADMWIHRGAIFPAGKFAKDTAFYVSMFDEDRCENKKGDRKKVSLKVIICDLIDCGDVLTNRVVEEDEYRAKKYTHSGTNWDAEIIWHKDLDSIIYYVNDVRLPVTTLHGFVFSLGLSTVKIKAYYLDIEDDCQFNVYVECKCPPTISDDEGNEYKITRLAGLCWTENLKAKKYAKNLGEGVIPFAKPYYSNLYPDTKYHFDTFGLLYDWHSALGETAGNNPAQGICPQHWHIPSQEEWALLDVFHAEDLKSKQFWFKPGIDEYGFDARPAGLYKGTTGRFEELYGFTGWWSSNTPGGTTQTAHYFSLNYYCSYLMKEVMQKGNGLSVRCVMDCED